MDASGRRAVLRLLISLYFANMFDYRYRKDGMPNPSFTACRDDLTAVGNALREFRLRRKERTAVKCSLQKAEIIDLMRRIKRHKRVITLAVTADNL